MDCGHQKKRCQMGLGAIWPKSDKSVKGFNLKMTIFWRAPKSWFRWLSARTKFYEIHRKCVWKVWRTLIFHWTCELFDRKVWKYCSQSQILNVQWFSTKICAIIENAKNCIQKSTNITADVWKKWNSSKNRCQYHCRRRKKVGGPHFCISILARRGERFNDLR